MQTKERKLLTSFLFSHAYIEMSINTRTVLILYETVLERPKGCYNMSKKFLRSQINIIECHSFACLFTGIRWI